MEMLKLSKLECRTWIVSENEFQLNIHHLEIVEYFETCLIWLDANENN